MAIREFECPFGHVTERVLIGSADNEKKDTVCDHCGAPAKWVKVSRTSPPRFKAGCGGFYKPTQETR